tara:strand:- start:78 stop:608 length:531 start_codon:yes stop_codon:yes gene_type:complete
MGMGATDNQDDFDKQIEAIKEMGFDHFSKFSPLYTVIPYGVSVLHDMEPDNNGRVETSKVFVEATNPVIAMAEMWDTHIQIAVAAGLSTIAELLRKAMNEGNLEFTVKNLCEMIESDDDEFVKAFLQAIYRTQPDVISIGNPNVLNNVIAGVVQPEKFSAEIEDFLKMVTDKEEEE